MSTGRDRSGRKRGGETVQRLDVTQDPDYGVGEQVYTVRRLVDRTLPRVGTRIKEDSLTALIAEGVRVVITES